MLVYNNCHQGGYKRSFCGCVPIEWYKSGIFSFSGVAFVVIWCLVKEKQLSWLIPNQVHFAA